MPRRTKVEVKVESLHTIILLVTEENDTSQVTPRFTGAKQTKTVSLKTGAQGHRHQSSNPLWSALLFVISVGVDCGSGSINTILLLPSVCEWCQRNQLEIRVGFKQSKCLWGWVSEPLPYTAEYSAFTLFQMGPVLRLTIWYDFTWTPEMSGEKWYVTVSGVCIILNMAPLVIIHSWLWLINLLERRSGQLHLTKDFQRQTFIR